ncbi:hypothetical protein BGX29_011919 [Mortierella sp. GBA35]|nr:hypothetical protein BGX29_011919 [Mortierella sp. GBA35]
MNHDKDVTRQYAATCLQVAQEYAAAALAREGGGGASGGSRLHQVDVIDTWGIMMAQVESGPRTLSDFLKDGIHLAAEGNNVIYEEIIKILRNKYSEWDPDKMLMHGPWWRQLDLDHPETDLLICGNKQHQSSHK